MSAPCACSPLVGAYRARLAARAAAGHDGPTEVGMDDANGAWWAWLLAFGAINAISYSFGWPFWVF